MNKPNIELDREPTPEELFTVMEAAQEDCGCTLDMKVDLEHGDETMCLPCAARQILNGVTSLAEKF